MVDVKMKGMTKLKIGHWEIPLHESWREMLVSLVDSVVFFSRTVYIKLFSL